MNYKSIFSVVLTLFIVNTMFSQKSTAHTENTIESSIKLNYLQYLPENYSPDNPEGFPLILFLHGSGERGSDLQKVKAWGPPKIAEEKGLPFIVISPQCPEGIWWNAILLPLKDLLDHAIENLNIDTSRIYLTGLSMGGFGTFALSQMYPDYFAAIAPVCGGGSPTLAKFSKNLPTWVFHGELDQAVPLESSQIMVDALKTHGSDVKFTIYEGVDHFSWIPAYNESELFDWFLKNKKQD